MISDLEGMTLEELSAIRGLGPKSALEIIMETRDYINKNVLPDSWLPMKVDLNTLERIGLSVSQFATFLQYKHPSCKELLVVPESVLCSTLKCAVPSGPADGREICNLISFLSTTVTPAAEDGDSNCACYKTGNVFTCVWYDESPAKRGRECTFMLKLSPGYF